MSPTIDTPNPPQYATDYVRCSICGTSIPQRSATGAACADQDWCRRQVEFHWARVATGDCEPGERLHSQ